MFVVVVSRFQKTVQALEEEGDAEKHQLSAMHQQRVMAHINERKKEAMACYTDALSENPPNVSKWKLVGIIAVISSVPRTLSGNEK